MKSRDRHDFLLLFIFECECILTKTRFNLGVVLSLSVACFLGSVHILYAQIHLTSGHFTKATFSNIDPCTGTTSAPTTIGQTCVGGALYAGTGYASPLNPSLRYMVTPGGCTDEICTGAGGTDGAPTQQAWATGTYASHSTQATDVTNGQNNTGVLVHLLQTGGNTTPAAAWCSGMNYGGYHDWFLPSTNELDYVLYKNSTQKGGNLGGFQSSWYWSSTENFVNVAWYQLFSNGAQSFNLKSNPNGYVRCVRIYSKIVITSATKNK